MKKRNKKRGQLSCIPRRQLSSPQKTFRPADQRKEGGRIFMIQDIRYDIKTYITGLYDKRINLKLQFPLLHIIPAGEDFYF